LNDQLRSEMRRLDFRGNLIVDRDNPVLVQKALRDRFSAPGHWKAGYGGEAYLSRPHSEDALTWNVFRSLQMMGPQGLMIIQAVFGLSTVQNILFWGCDVESRSEPQQYLNCLIRGIDGRHRGTMTEPDLVVISDAEVAFVECKLNANGRESPWKAQGSGAEKRFRTYVNECGFKELEEIPTWEPMYQFIRQYVYARRLAELLDRRPLVFALIREEHVTSWGATYQPLRAFNPGIFRPFVTWQAIRNALAGTGDDRVAAKIVDGIDKALGSASKECQ